jgi:predicted nuclease with TOPRIM domain
MLDDKDIQKLVSILATKKDLDDMVTNSLKIFATKQDVGEIKSDVVDLKELLQSLIVSVDKMAKSMEILGAEYKAVSVQLTRHEKWIKQISEKVGVQLSFE